VLQQLRTRRSTSSPGIGELQMPNHEIGSSEEMRDGRRERGMAVAGDVRALTSRLDPRRAPSDRRLGSSEALTRALNVTSALPWSTFVI
jgi:hypothetical protein